MSASEQYVQVAPDSDGKKIRNLELSVLQTDGTVATVEMQVVTIAKSDGTILDLDQTDVLDGILVELRRIRLGLQLLTDNDLAARDAATT